VGGRDKHGEGRWRAPPASARGAAVAAWVERYAGTLAALLAGLFVGGLLLWGAASRDVPSDPVRSFGLLPGLLVGGLALDRWQARAPRQGLAYVERASLYWAAVFPFARVGQDLLAFAHYRMLDPTADLAREFPAFAGPGAFVGFLLFQAVFGAGFGLGFAMIARRLAVAARRLGARSRPA
jgi:hypothetical protein